MMMYERRELGFWMNHPTGTARSWWDEWGYMMRGEDTRKVDGYGRVELVSAKRRFCEEWARPEVEALFRYLHEQGYGAVGLSDPCGEYHPVGLWLPESEGGGLMAGGPMFDSPEDTRDGHLPWVQQVSATMGAGIEDWTVWVTLLDAEWSPRTPVYWMRLDLGCELPELLVNDQHLNLDYTLPHLRNVMQSLREGGFFTSAEPTYPDWADELLQRRYHD
jgi:hypothetical protein